MRAAGGMWKWVEFVVPLLLTVVLASLGRSGSSRVTVLLVRVRDAVTVGVAAERSFLGAPELPAPDAEVAGVVGRLVAGLLTCGSSRPDQTWTRPPTDRCRRGGPCHRRRRRRRRAGSSVGAAQLAPPRTVWRVAVGFGFVARAGFPALARLTRVGVSPTSCCSAGGQSLQPTSGARARPGRGFRRRGRWRSCRRSGGRRRQLAAHRAPSWRKCCQCPTCVASPSVGCVGMLYAVH